MVDNTAKKGGFLISKGILACLVIVKVSREGETMSEMGHISRRWP